MTKKIFAIIVAIAIAISGTIIGVTAHNVKKAKATEEATAASDEDGSGVVSISDDLNALENAEAKKSADKVEAAFTLNEAELKRELARYGLENGVMSRNSFPDHSAGEALTTGFSFTDKQNGKYTFNADTVKKELKEETLNPVFLSARFQCLLEKGDPVIKYLDNTKTFVDKLKTEPLSHWLKTDENGNLKIGENGEYYLTEEYLRGALVACYLNDEGYPFSTEYYIWTGETPDAVITWRKNIVDDNFDYDNDLKPIRDGSYKEAHKWASFLVVRQVLKSGKVVSEEIFDLYDKAPCIFFVKEKEEEPTTTVKEGKGDVPTTKPVEPTTKKTTEPSTKPVEPTTKPVEPTTKKTTEPSTKPVEPTTKPVEPTTKPVEPTTKKTTEPTTKKTNPPKKDKSKDPVNQGANLITDLAGAFQELMPEKSTTGPIYVAPTTQPTTRPAKESATTEPTTAPVAVPTHVNESNYKDNKGNDVKINDGTVFSGKIVMPPD